MKSIVIGAALFVSLLTMSAVNSQEMENAPPPSVGVYETLRVGVTGVLCYTEPCPWNGVLRSGQPTLSHAIIWSGRTAPRLIGAPDDVARVAAAYADGCLIVDGKMIADTLEIQRISGNC